MSEDVLCLQVAEPAARDTTAEAYDTLESEMAVHWLD